MKRTADIISVETSLLLELAIEDMLHLLASDARLMCNFTKFAEAQLKESCANNSPQVTAKTYLLT